MCWPRSKQTKRLSRWSRLQAVLCSNIWSIKVRLCLSTRRSRWLATRAKKWMLLQLPRRKQKASRKKSQQSRQQTAVSLHQKRMKSPLLPRRLRLPQLHKQTLHPSLYHLLLSRPEKMVTLKPPHWRRRSPEITKWIYPTCRAQARVDALSARMLKPCWPVVSHQLPAAHQQQPLMHKLMLLRKIRLFKPRN